MKRPHLLKSWCSTQKDGGAVVRRVRTLLVQQRKDGGAGHGAHRKGPRGLNIKIDPKNTMGTHNSITPHFPDSGQRQ